MDTPTTAGPAPEQQFYGSYDICNLLGIGYTALVRRRTSGDGPPCEKQGNTWRYPKDAYHTWYYQEFTPEGTGPRKGDPNRETWEQRQSVIKYGKVDPRSEKRNKLEYALWARQEPQLHDLVLRWRLLSLSWVEIRDAVHDLVGPGVGVSHEAYRGWFHEFANQRQRIDPATFNAMLNAIAASAAA
jgi:hypothetical protein